ncbi:hypothetical protein AVEN_48743-1 [Araneus ventricosus]|uniref:Uncharacterized protein n=1 Tax=Araneus ventricosus TaxID=182803 RepID=A0A4Y2IVJ8_ARAVE|nr:hypothetical protein AVEN_48743-1 [Araneus ventricosus]
MQTPALAQTQQKYQKFIPHLRRTSFRRGSTKKQKPLRKSENDIREDTLRSCHLQQGRPASLIPTHALQDNPPGHNSKPFYEHNPRKQLVETGESQVVENGRCSLSVERTSALLIDRRCADFFQRGEKDATHIFGPLPEGVYFRYVALGRNWTEETKDASWGKRCSSLALQQEGPMRQFISRAM